jgi:hypothetical protein
VWLGGSVGGGRGWGGGVRSYSGVLLATACTRKPTEIAECILRSADRAVMATACTCADRDCSPCNCQEPPLLLRGLIGCEAAQPVLQLLIRMIIALEQACSSGSSCCCCQCCLSAVVGYCSGALLAATQRDVKSYLGVVRATPWATGAQEAAFLLEALLTADAPRCWSCIVACIMLVT